LEQLKAAQPKADFSDLERQVQKAIQELGHSTLSMTLRSMHLAPSPCAKRSVLLDYGQPVGSAQSAAV
jgi:hypothetical protein